MRALVVYESMFGNTRDVAEAIARGLASHGDVDLSEVGNAPQRVDAEVDLLVVGGPTHAFGMSRARTRRDAGRQKGSAVFSAGIGIREWLEQIGSARPGVSAAAFDTKIDKPVPGSAAHKAEKILRRHGYYVATHSETFRVADTAGPLLPGEVERACAWGERFGAALAGRGAGEVVR